MRDWLATAGAAAFATAITALQAALTSAQLAEQNTRARLRLDPLGSASGAIALGLIIAAYLWLGRTVRRRGGSPRTAQMYGLVGGLASGLVGGAVQAWAVSDYLAGALALIHVPPFFLPVALGLYAALLTMFGALVAAASAWFGARGGPPGGASTPR